MKNSEYKVAIDPRDANIFTEDDLDAIKVFRMNNETEVVRNAFIAFNRLYNGEPLKVSAEFCKNARAKGRLSKDGLDVWLCLWTVDTYNNRVIKAQTYMTIIWDITDNKRGRQLMRQYGVETVYERK